ncbi:MAG: hypothetical protein J0L60_05805 [Ignavibacteria bacterium]|nr:hypothetical protein [Ignavibacteria bacterium]
MKIALRNYTLDIEKSDKKVLTQFVKQAVKQTSGSQEVGMVKQNRIFSTILDKINESDSVKFTKDEYFTLKNMVVANHNHLKKQISKAGFFKKFFFSSLEKQYGKLLTKYFQEK